MGVLEVQQQRAEVGGKQAAVKSAYEQLAGAEVDVQWEHHIKHANPIKR